MPYALFWKGRRLRDMGTFRTRKEAETVRGIEMTQMELADYTPKELDRWLKVKKVTRKKRKPRILCERRKTRSGKYTTICQCKIVKKPSKDFDKRSFRTIKKDKGVRIIIGCPKGKWDDKKKRCKVGTRVQKILYPKSRCKR